MAGTQDKSIDELLLETENNFLREKVDELGKLQSSLEKSKNELEEKVAELQNELEVLNEQKKEAIKDSQNKIRGIEGELKRMEILNKKRSDELAKCKTKIESQDKDLTSQKFECAKHIDDIITLQDQIITLQDQIIRHMAEINRHMAEISQHMAEIIRHKAEIIRHMAEINQLQSQIIVHKEQEDHLSKKIAALRKGINTSQMTSLRQALVEFDKRIPKISENASRSDNWQRHFEDSYYDVLKNANFRPNVKDVVKSVFYKVNSAVHGLSPSEVTVLKDSFDSEEIDFLKIVLNLSPLRKGTLTIL